MNSTYDVIIVGAGIMGSAAAYALAKHGQSVLLLEQFPLEHHFGSSHDVSRIIRYAYDHPAYVELAKANYPAWLDFEEAAGEQMYFKTGGLDFGHPSQPYLQDLVAALSTQGIPFEQLNPSEAEARFPQFRFDEDMTVIYQADAGVLAATRAVLAHVRLAQAHGAQVLADTPVTRITPTLDGVTVEAGGSRYSAARVIIASGSWAAPMLEELGLSLSLRPMRCQPSYFTPMTTPTAFDIDRFPTFIAHVTGYYGDFHPYGMASLDGSGVKVGFHGGETVDHVSQINYTPDADLVDRVRAFISRHIPDANGPLNSTRICLYTMTPDEHFIIDHHPVHPQIILCSACSGHGFKFGTLIGMILRDLAIEGTTPHNIALFRVSRFLDGAAGSTTNGNH